MGVVISVFNQKGGVAKTTTATNLASMLAIEHGKKVLLVDNDSQANTTNSVGIYDEDLELTIQHLYDETMLSWNTVRSALLDIELIPGLKLLPANIMLSKVELTLVTALNRERKLKKILDIVRELFDYIIIDCPPSIGLLAVNALVASDHVIVPVNMNFYSMKGTKILCETIELIQENFNPHLDILGVLITKYQSRTNIGKKLKEILSKEFEDKVFDAVIRTNIEIENAQDSMKPVNLFNTNCHAYVDYYKFSKEVIDRVNN